MMKQPVPSVKPSTIKYSIIEEEEEEVVVETIGDSELSSSAADKYGIEKPSRPTSSWRRRPPCGPTTC